MDVAVCKTLRIFQQQKSTCLAKADLSRKGSVDEPIVDLIQFINGCDQYFTTSSCSGRICLYEEPVVATRKKGCSGCTSHTAFVIGRL